MEDRLRKKMYFRSGKDKPSRLFDVVYGSVISESFVFVKNVGWYNKKGENLGFGDLAEFHVEKMKKELLPGEFFIILSQQDSWEGTIKEAHKKSPGKVKDDIDEPGPLYVSSRAWMIVAKGNVYEVTLSQTSQKHRKRGKIRTDLISREEAINFILKGKKPPS